MTTPSSAAALLSAHPLDVLKEVSEPPREKNCRSTAFKDSLHPRRMVRILLHRKISMQHRSEESSQASALPGSEPAESANPLYIIGLSLKASGRSDSLGG